MLGKTKPAAEAIAGTSVEQCCALVPSFPNASRCTEPGFQGWHYCDEHLEGAGDLIATDQVVTEIDYQSPVRRRLDS